MSKRERREFSKTLQHLERVEKMRPYFGDVFKPDSGYDLRKPDAWTPAMKARVTKYYRIMAPRLTPENKVVKRYRRKDHIQRAILATYQEKLLPGQTAAVFTVDPGQDLEIEFNKYHEPIVRRAGVRENEYKFDKKNLAADPLAEIARILDEIGDEAKVFKIVTGGNTSSESFTREALIDRVLEWMKSYESADATRQQGPYSFDAQPWDQWMHGVVAMKGTTLRQQAKRDTAHEKAVAQRSVNRKKIRAEHDKLMRETARDARLAKGIAKVKYV